MKRILFFSLLSAALMLGTTSCDKMGKLKLPFGKSNGTEEAVVAVEGEEVEAEEADDNRPATKLYVSNVRDIANTLAPAHGNTYYASNLFDNNSNTAWSITMSRFFPDNDMRWGPTMNINAKKLNYVKIQNGYGKGGNTYYNNTRPAWIMIYRVGSRGGYPNQKDIIYAGPLEDTMSYQTLPVNSKYDNSRPTKEVGIAFSASDSDYYWGRKWQDLTVSELEFYGIPL